MPAPLIRSLRRCRIIARYGVGVDTIDLDAASAAGIMVTNVPDYCVQEVSDHALALILTLARGIGRAMLSTRQGAWDLGAVRPLRRLEGQTLALLGFGRMGRAVAEKARPLGFRIIAYDPYLPADVIRKSGAEPVDLDTALGEADYLSVHVPLSDETRHLIDSAALERMKPTAYLVNTSRGGIVDTEALVEALQAGKLAGAALDVLEQEPPPADLELLQMPNVILTPHTAFYSEESLIELQTKAAEEVVSVISGKAPRNPVNPEVLQGQGTR